MPGGADRDQVLSGGSSRAKGSLAGIRSQEIKCSLATRSHLAGVGQSPDLAHLKSTLDALSLLCPLCGMT